MSSQDLSSQETLQPIVASDRRSGIGRWLWAAGLGILLLGGGFFLWRLFGSRGNQAAMQMPPGVAVGLEAVQTGRVQETSEFVGSLEAQAGVALQPEVSGRITQVFVTAGDRVTAGTPIALISPDQTEAELNAATAQVAAARSARDSAGATLRSLVSQRAELAADLELQQANFNRIATLVEQGALSEQQLDVARRDLDVARAAVASAAEDIAAAEASVEESRASLAQAQANEAAVSEDLQDRTVTAPIAGVVGDLDIKLGDYVTPDSVITNITENASLELDLQVPVEERDRLRLGLPVQILTSNGTDVAATGSVSFISPQTNADTQTVLIKARFDNPQGVLQDAQQVEARLIWSEERDVLVPTSAITRLGGQTFVYVADAGTPEELPPPESLPPNMPAPDQVARLRPVELGAIQGNNYQILSGLEPGETIVTSGILNLQDGTPILPQTAGESQGGPPPPQ